MSCAQNFRMFDDPFASTPDELKMEIRQSDKIPNIDVILSKYLNNLELTDVELQQLSEHERFVMDQVQQKNTQKKKRPDEYQKMFYKKAFKFAQRKFFAKNKKNKSRRMSQFYHHYFDKVATAMGIPLINFYHPDKKTRPGYRCGQKSFNSTYIRLLLRSSQFKVISRDYHKLFVNECTKERNKKIGQFSKSLVKVIQKARADRAEISRYMQSSQCKIPWSNNDISQAWRRAGLELESTGDNDQKQEADFDCYQEQQKRQSKESVMDEESRQNSFDFESLLDS